MREILLITKQNKAKQIQPKILTDLCRLTGMNKGIVIKSPKQFNKVTKYYQALAFITHFPPNHLNVFHHLSVRNLFYLFILDVLLVQY